MQLLKEPLGHPSLSPLIEAFNEVGTQTSIDPCLLAAIAEEESTWNRLALSFDGNFGRGLMQIDAAFHPFADQGVVYVAPARWITGGGRTGRAVDAQKSLAEGAPIFDVQRTLLYACQNLLAPAFAQFAGRADEITCVIASYNAGITGVSQAVAAGRTPESATFDPNYVPKIVSSYAWLSETSRNNAAAPT